MTTKLAALWNEAAFLKHLVAGVLSAGLAVAGAAWAASAKWHSVETRISGVERRVEAHEGAPSLHPTIAEAAEQSARLTRIESKLEALADDVSEIKDALRAR